MNTSPPKVITPNDSMPSELSPEEIEEERQVNNQRIAFLDAKLASFTSIQRLQLNQWLAKFAKQSIHSLTDFLSESGIIKVQNTPVKVSLVILSSADMQHHLGHVPAGVAWIDTATIGLLDHLVLAPEEVVKSVLLHECLHILYPQAKLNLTEPLTVRPGIVDQYPLDQHAEEEWVRRMDHKILGEIDYLELWEVAVEEFGANWQRYYEKLKQCSKAPGSPPCLVR